ncbi:hypothetical protein [Streptomyces laurentii]|uniref:hypothetical protein n=1 Tax=Streptomyces laurentii TaxID=39478 RepID=UPI0033F02E61
MRTKDVRVGESYRCEVPGSLPTRRYNPHTIGDSWLPLIWLRGTFFTLTITDVDTQARTAQGLRVGSTARLTIELTDDQAATAGLPPGHTYRLDGTLLDADDEPVELPRVGELTVPTRWLHPLDTPPPPAHRDATLRRY